MIKFQHSTDQPICWRRFWPLQSIHDNYNINKNINNVINNNTNDDDGDAYADLLMMS